VNSILTVGDGCECCFVLVLGYGMFMCICLVRFNSKQSVFVVMSLGQSRQTCCCFSTRQGLEEVEIGSLLSEVSRAVAMETNVELKCVSGMKGSTRETRFSIRL
jgi:hypothetical protein